MVREAVLLRNGDNERKCASSGISVGTWIGEREAAEEL
jgi:hypothetical protein